MTDPRLEEVLACRDAEAVGSIEWERLNEEKADYLESIKPSTRERVVCFLERDLGNIAQGFARGAALTDISYFIERRSAAEYHPLKRHPIPYALIRHEDRYFFILRGQGGGELRLIGKKGLIGGHVSEEDVIEGDLGASAERALRREAQEEAGLEDGDIVSVELRGTIKSDLGVDIDHLGLVYEIEVKHERLKAEEEGVLTGIWIPRTELAAHRESFENWALMVYDNLLKQDGNEDV